MVQTMEKINLLTIAKFMLPYVKSIVLELYARIKKDITNKDSRNYMKVYFRGQYFDFNPSIICDFLGISKQKDELDVDWNKISIILTRGVQKTWSERNGMPS